MKKNPWCGTSRAALAICLAMTALPAFAQTKLAVGKAAAQADSIIVVNIGDQLGIFKKHGLDLKIIDFQGGSKMLQAMVAGEIDIGIGSGSQMEFIAKGVGMMAVCENAAIPAFFAIGVPYDSPLQSLKDLKGKVVGVSSAGSLTDWLVQQLSHKEGWGAEGITRLPIGSSTAASTAAFRLKRIDAYVGGTATFFGMEEQKVGRLLAPVSSYMGPMAAGTIYASSNVIKRDPDAIRAFLGGWLDTHRYMKTHKAETVKMESTITGFSENVMSRDYDIVIGMYSDDCKFRAESLATLKQSFIDLKLLDEPIDMSKFYTEAYLPK